MTCNNIHYRGNVLFLILLAVALFAALSYAVTQSNRSGGSNASNENHKLKASQIVQYTASIKQAYDRLRLINNCKNTDISFENSDTSGYEHTPVATDDCKIFNIAGGGVPYVAPDPDYLDSAFSGDMFYGHWHMDATNTYPYVGTSGTDEVAVNLYYLNREICLAVNDLVGINNPSGEPPIEGGGICSNKYQGVLGSGSCGVNGNVNYNGRLAGCFQVTAVPAANAYIYFDIMEAR